MIDESSRRLKGKKGEDDEEDEGGEEEKKEGQPKRKRHAASRPLPEDAPPKAPIYLDQDSPYPLPRSFSPHASVPSSSRPKARRTVSGSSAVVPNRPEPVRTFKKERQKPKKKVLAVAVASSFATLIVVCAVILFVTDGKGTDVFWQDAVSKSKSIKSDTEKLAGQISGKKDGSLQEAPAEGSSSQTSASPQGQPASSDSAPASPEPQQKADSAPASPEASHPAASPDAGSSASSQGHSSPSSSPSQEGSGAQKKDEKEKKPDSTASQTPPDSALSQKSSPDAGTSGSKN